MNRKIFGTLFFSLFATVTGVGIVVPLLPVYATELGAGGFAVGLIFGSFSLTRSAFLPYFGRRSDFIGRKPYIIAGLLGYTLISFMFVIADSVFDLILLRFTQGIASAMIMPVIQAYVGDITPKGREGFTMGVFNISIFVGLSIGPLCGGIIKDSWGLGTTFWFMGFFSLTGLLLSLFLLPPYREEVNAGRGIQPPAFSRLLHDRELIGLFSFRFAYTACIGIIWSFLPVFAAVDFHLSSSATGVLVTLGVLVSSGLQTPVGYLADRIDKRMLICAGGIIAALGTLLFTFAQGFWYLFAFNFCFGIGGGLSHAPHMGMSVMKGQSLRAMGSVMSLITMAHSLGMMVGAIFAGVMMDLFDLRKAFVFGAFIMFAGTSLFYTLTHPGVVKHPKEAASNQPVT